MRLAAWGCAVVMLGAVFVAGCRQSSSPPPAQQARPQDPVPGPAPDTIVRPSHPAGPYGLCVAGLPHFGMWKCDPVFVDVNRDGHQDLAALPRLGKGLHVWLGDGAGNWEDTAVEISANESSCGGGLDFGDLNEDGHLDVAIADHCNGIFILLGDGTGNWTTVVSGLYPSDMPAAVSHVRMLLGAEDLVLGDVNSDGHLDLVVGSSDEGGINVYLGDGTGVNWARQNDSLPKGRWTVRVQLHDVNGDGTKDLVAAHAGGPRVWLNDGKANWTLASDGLPAPLYEGLYTGIALADLDGDGRDDIATANWIDGPEVYFQQADGSWVKAPDVFPELLGGSVGLDLADLNADGHIDIVVSGRMGVDGGYVRGVFALLNDGQGKWSFWSNSGLPATGLFPTTGVDLADIDGDGKPDIAAASGLIPESTPGQPGPLLNERMIVWCSQARTSNADVPAAGQ